MRGLVRRQADMPENPRKNAEEEHPRAGDKKRKYGGKHHRDGKQWPSHVNGLTVDCRLEREGQREVRIEADTLDPVPIGADEILLFPDQRHDTTSSRRIGDDSGMNGRAANE